MGLVLPLTLSRKLYTPHAMKGISSGFGAIENGAWWNPGARQNRELAPEQPA